MIRVDVVLQMLLHPLNSLIDLIYLLVGFVELGFAAVHL